MTDIDKSVGELLPCPFCGKHPESGWHGSLGEGYYGIDCCNAFAHGEDEADATAQWNKRAALQSAQQAPASEAVSDVMIDAYLTAQQQEIERQDSSLEAIQPRKACAIGLAAALRTADQSARIAELEKALDDANYRAGMAEVSVAMLKGHANAFMQQAQEAGAELEKSERKIIGLGVLAMGSVAREAYAARADQITELKYERDELRRQLAEAQATIEATRRIVALGSSQCARDALDVLQSADTSALSAAIAAAVEPYKADAECLREALESACKALEAIADEMTVGERYTNAGQLLIDALPMVRSALTGGNRE